MIYLSTDHGGFELKEEIKAWLLSNNKQVEDMGAYSLNPADDYPDYIIPMAKRVATEPGSFGLVLGRSGNGEVIAANKIPGIRAVLCFNEKMAQVARTHNNANILSIGADYLDPELIKNIITTFLDTPFPAEERHVRRLQKVEEAEKENGR